jgi:hypothetical protein
MRVEVRPINQNGRPLGKAERQSSPPSRGRLKVAENRLHSFGRVVMCAKLVSATDGLETELLPELLDAELIWLDGETIRLRGVEQVGGALFGQTWDIKVL